MNMKKKTRSYEDWLLQRLRDPEEAVAYLNAYLEDDEDDEDFEKHLLVALRNVAKAHGFTTIAEKTHLRRESLYKTLSENGAPKLKTIIAVLDAMGLRIQIETNDKQLASGATP